MIMGDNLLFMLHTWVIHTVPLESDPKLLQTEVTRPPVQKFIMENNRVVPGMGGKDTMIFLLLNPL